MLRCRGVEQKTKPEEGFNDLLLLEKSFFLFYRYVLK